MIVIVIVIVFFFGSELLQGAGTLIEIGRGIFRRTHQPLQRVLRGVGEKACEIGNFRRGIGAVLPCGGMFGRAGAIRPRPFAPSKKRPYRVRIEFGGQNVCQRAVLAEQVVSLHVRLARYRPLSGQFVMRRY